MVNFDSAIGSQLRKDNRKTTKLIMDKELRDKIFKRLDKELKDRESLEK